MERAASSVVIALLFERNSFVNDFYDICSLQEIVYERLWDQAGHNLKVICAMHDLSISLDFVQGLAASAYGFQNNYKLVW